MYFPVRVNFDLNIVHDLFPFAFVVLLLFNSVFVKLILTLSFPPPFLLLVFFFLILLLVQIHLSAALPLARLTRG